MKTIKAKDIQVGMVIINGSRREKVTEIFTPASEGKAGFATEFCEGYIQDKFSEVDIEASK